MNEPLELSKYNEISNILRNCHTSDFRLFLDVIRSRQIRERNHKAMDAILAGKVKFTYKGTTYTARVIRHMRKNLLVVIESGWGRFGIGTQVRVSPGLCTPLVEEKVPV